MVEFYGIYQALREDHARLRSMLADLSSDSEGAAGRFVEVQGELTRHERAEERTFYEALLRPGTTHEVALEGYEEHHVADMILGEMGDMDPSDERWRAKAKVLRETVEHHISEEEDDVFRAARQAMDTDWAARAAKEFISEKALLERGH